MNMRAGNFLQVIKRLFGRITDIRFQVKRRKPVTVKCHNWNRPPHEICNQSLIN